MAFATTDFKKTTRRSTDDRMLYPYQIRDDRYTAAIGYAISYYERMVGRRRAEFETDTLLEFFGDPKLARGLVACLGKTYLWRQQTFYDALGLDVAQALQRADITSPADLRARLYGLANGRYGGFIAPSERPEALAFLCGQIGDIAGAATVQPDDIERGLTLDAEDQWILVKQGPMPTAADIIARYNYHSLETAITRAAHLHLTLRGPVWSIVRSAHNLARRYRLRYSVDGNERTLFDDRVTLTLYGGRDALGSWTRSGKRLARALLRLLATHPNTMTGGEALVHLNGSLLTLRLDDRAMAVLGVAARQEAPDSEAWEEATVTDFQRAWTRAHVAGRTAGWRIRRDPEPMIGTGTVIIPDFVLARGNERVALCVASGQAAALSLTRDLGRLGNRTPAVALIPSEAAERLPTCPVPLAAYDDQPADAIPAIVGVLDRRYPRRTEAPRQTPWQRLEQMVADEGFVGSDTVATLLGTPADEALREVGKWGGTGLHVLPGLGVCSAETLGDIRKLLTRAES